LPSPVGLALFSAAVVMCICSIGKRMSHRAWKARTMFLVSSAATSSSPVCRWLSKPQKVSRIQPRSSAATGQAADQVERAITSAGAGLTVLEAKLLPGSSGSVSGRVKSRLTSSGGVCCGGITPCLFFFSTRVPSQAGGVVPSRAADVVVAAGVVGAGVVVGLVLGVLLALAEGVGVLLGDAGVGVGLMLALGNGLGATRCPSSQPLSAPMRRPEPARAAPTPRSSRVVTGPA